MVAADTICQDHERIEVPGRQELIVLNPGKTIMMLVEILPIDVCGILPASFETPEDCFISSRTRSFVGSRIEPEPEMYPFFRLAEIDLAGVMVRVVGAEINSSVAGHLCDERRQDHPRIHPVIALAGILRLKAIML